VETGANDHLAAVSGEPPPLPAEPGRRQSCGTEPEPGCAIALCGDCRTRMARNRIPIGIKLAGLAIALLLILALTRIPSSISAAIWFERGERSEQKLQFATAESEYQKSVQAFPRSDLAHARLFVAAYRARDIGTARHEFEYLRGRQLDAKLVGEISALLGSRH
jgi:hypothetical protein